MRKLRLYIETSVWSHYYADDAPQRRDETREFFEWCAGNGERLVLCVSAYVLQEIEDADVEKRGQLHELLARHLPTILPPDDDARKLAEAYAVHGAIPSAKTADALHAAMATVHDADALASWNYRHLVNMRRRRAINAVNAMLGYCRPLWIVTPPEVMTHEV